MQTIISVSFYTIIAWLYISFFYFLLFKKIDNLGPIPTFYYWSGQRYAYEVNLSVRPEITNLLKVRKGLAFKVLYFI